MATRFRLDKKAFGIHVLQSEGMQRAMRRFAEPVKSRAEAIAPVSSVDHQHYRDSFSIEVSVRTVPPYRTRRAVATVGNSRPYAIELEYGNKRTPRYRVLGRALGKF